MKCLSVTLSALLLGAAALSATAAPNTPSSPNSPATPPVPDEPMKNPPISHPPGPTTYCPPIVPNARAPGASTHPRTPPVAPAPGASTGTGPCS